MSTRRKFSFLLEEFPPRDREKPDGGTQEPTPPAP